MSTASAIREARLEDVPAMADVAVRSWRQHQEYEPLYWRVAEDARERQVPFLEYLVQDDEWIALVHEGEGGVDGFLCGHLLEAPPAYDPGGLTCLVDDFMVARPALWPTVGEGLLEQLAEEAAARGAVQLVVICAQRHEAKRALLAGLGYSVASEWRVRRIEQGRA